MNKLRARIREATSVAQAPLGFGAGGRKKNPTLLLLVRGRGDDLAGLDGQLDGYISTSGKTQGADGVAVGIEGAEAGGQHGVDFMVIDEKMPATTLLDEEMAYLLRLPTDLPDSLLRALEPLHFDGLIVSGGTSLTVRDQLELVRLAGFTRKPLFIALGDTPDSRTLEVLRDAGVLGLVLDASIGAATISALREAIAGLPPRKRQRREERDAVTLPAASAAVEEEDEFEEV